MTVERRETSVLNPDCSGLPLSPQEKKYRENLHTSATWLFKGRIYNWSAAFDLSDGQLLKLEGIGPYTLSGIRKFQKAIKAHKEVLKSEAEKEIYIGRPSKVSHPHGIVVDGIFVPQIINPGSNMLFISLLTGSSEEERNDFPQNAEDQTGESHAAQTLESLYGNVRFLNDNFGLGLRIRASLGKEKVEFSLQVPARIKIIFPRFNRITGSRI